MSRFVNYERPASLQEAMSILREKKGRAVVLGGGTSLSIRPQPRVDTLVDMSQLGLTGIEEEGNDVVIQAWTTVSEVEASPLLKSLYGGVVSKCAARMGSTPLRNVITVGGNVVQVFPWSDLPGVLMALDASIVVQGEAQRAAAARDFFAAHPRTFLDPDEVVTQIRIPKPSGHASGAYAKVSKTVVDYAALSVTAVCEFDGSEVTHCAVALGSVRPLPVRVRPAEEEMIGRVPGREDVLRAAGRAAGAIEASVDYRYSKEYRRQLIKTWVKRCLFETVGKGGGNG